MRGIKLSASFISLAVLLGIGCIGLVAGAQEPEPNTGTDTGTARPVPTRTGVATTSRPISELPVRAQTAPARSEGQGANTTLPTEALERILAMINNMSARVDAILGRLSHIADRIEARIRILTDEGIDTTAAQAELNTAKNALDNANAIFSRITAEARAAIMAGNPRQALVEFRSSMQLVRTEIQTAHQALRSAIEAMKRSSGN